MCHCKLQVGLLVFGPGLLFHDISRVFATWLVLRPLLERASAPCGILVGRCGVVPKEGFLQGHWVRASNSEAAVFG